MEDDADMLDGEGGVGTMVTALAWVGRGFAKPLLDSYEPSAKEIAKSSKLAKKLLKGNENNQEMGDAVREAEKKME